MLLYLFLFNSIVSDPKTIVPIGKARNKGEVHLQLGWIHSLCIILGLGRRGNYEYVAGMQVKSRFNFCE